MHRTQTTAQDFLGIAAFVSAVGNLVQAADRRKLAVIYKNLVTRYNLLYREYQAFLQVNKQLQEEVLRLRSENNRLVRQVTAKETPK